MQHIPAYQQTPKPLLIVPHSLFLILKQYLIIKVPFSFFFSVLFPQKQEKWWREEVLLLLPRHQGPERDHNLPWENEQHEASMKQGKLNAEKCVYRGIAPEKQGGKEARCLLSSSEAPRGQGLLHSLLSLASGAIQALYGNLLAFLNKISPPRLVVEGDDL